MKRICIFLILLFIAISLYAEDSFEWYSGGNTCFGTNGASILNTPYIYQVWRSTDGTIDAWDWNTHTVVVGGNDTLVYDYGFNGGWDAAGGFYESDSAPNSGKSLNGAVNLYIRFFDTTVGSETWTAIANAGL
ncbi:MAG: hypothetical protein PH343_08240, partial [Nitrospira sp.]|nr:hypothetical protein [Nitrospira sp.]